MGDDSNESDVSLMQCYDPLLPKAKIDMVRLGSIYQTVRSRPSILQDGCSREQDCAKRTLDGVKELRFENTKICSENQRLCDSLFMPRTALHKYIVMGERCCYCV